MSKNTSSIQTHILERFTILKKIGSGAYGHVWKVYDKQNKQIYALKKIFDAFQHSTDAQRTYRQIQILQQTKHPNIIKLYETIKAENNKDVYLIFQFMEADLHNVILQGILKDVHIKFIIYQTAKAIKYLHSGMILHRDLKPSNILINSDCSIKLCDFGLVRSIMNADETNPVLTQGIATRWYRAPEVLFGSKCYSTPADIWSFGCIIYEILAQKPMFPGSSTLNQLEKVIAFCGFPNQQDLKSLDSQVAKTMLKQIKITPLKPSKNLMMEIPFEFRDFLEKILVFNPKKRLTMDQILEHEIMKTFRKKEQEIICKQQIRTSIDDNRRLSVDQYRKLIYRNRKIDSQQLTVLVKSNSERKSNHYEANKSSDIPRTSYKFTEKNNTSSNIKKSINQSRQSNNQNPQNNRYTLKNVKSSKDLKNIDSHEKINNRKTEIALQKGQDKAIMKEMIKQPQKVKYTAGLSNYYSQKSMTTELKKSTINCCPWNLSKNTIVRQDRTKMQQKQSTTFSGTTYQRIQKNS